MTSPRHIATARDALAVTRATFEGHTDAAADVVATLEPAEVPALIGALVSLVRTALATSPDVPPPVFLEACAALLEHPDTPAS